MSRNLAATPDQVTVRPDEDLAEEFWDLVCAEDEWLRTEFDAIVTREFPDRLDPGRAQVPRWPSPASRGAGSAADARLPRGDEPPVRRPPRQRSPPAER